MICHHNEQRQANMKNDFQDSVSFELDPRLDDEARGKALENAGRVIGVFSVAARKDSPVFDVVHNPAIDIVLVGRGLASIAGVQTVSMTPAAFKRLSASLNP